MQLIITFFFMVLIQMQSFFYCNIMTSIFHTSTFLYFVELQETVAHLLGKEEGLFVASGTMGNLISGRCGTLSEYQ